MGQRFLLYSVSEGGKEFEVKTYTDGSPINVISDMRNRFVKLYYTARANSDWFHLNWSCKHKFLAYSADLLTRD